MPQDWRDIVCGQLHVSHWERGIPDVSEEVDAQLKGSGYGGEVGVSECQLTWECEQRRVYGMKHSFRAHLGRCSMLMCCNKASSSQCHITKCVRHSWTHHIFQVLFPSPRLPCRWGGGTELLQPVDCEQKLGISLPGRSMRARVHYSIFSPLP